MSFWGKQTGTDAKQGRGRGHNVHSVGEIDGSPMDTEDPRYHHHMREEAQRQHQLQRPVGAVSQKGKQTWTNAKLKTRGSGRGQYLYGSPMGTYPSDHHHMGEQAQRQHHVQRPVKAVSHKGKQTQTNAKLETRGSGRGQYVHCDGGMDGSPIGIYPSEDYHMGEQAQTQHQLQRSVEASKQMLYGVFGNVITILEEYEQRELAKYRMKHNMPKSEIYIPDQRHKNFEDIKSIVETQLLLFETQTKACPPEALAEVHEELKRKTLAWAAVREEMGIKETQQTDYYMSKLYEILAKGATTHRPIQNRDVTEGVMKETFQAFLYGDHDRAKLDKEFKNNPDKKATGPKTRSSEMLRDGASRLARANNAVDGYLKEDVNKFERYGPGDLK